MKGGPFHAFVDESGLQSGDSEWLTCTQRGSREELLLALRDAIGWARGASGHWSRLVEGILEVRDVVEKG